jgi:putative ABC transport system ATP-binding protein
MPTPVLVAHRITKIVSTHAGTAEELVILDAIDLEINAGESVAVVGASGSGKTTLLGILAGLDTPTSGTVALDGHELTELSEEQRARLRGELVGFVFQSFQLLGSLTALEADPRGDALELLRRVGLRERTSHYPRQLSGGEQQRVAIARAFASRPKVLFADEPTGNLDSVTGAKIIDLLFELNVAFATTLVLVTHDKHLADRCDRVIELDAGQVVAVRASAA